MTSKSITGYTRFIQLWGFKTALKSKKLFLFFQILLKRVNREQRRADLATSRSGYVLDKREEQQNKVTNREKANRISPGELAQLRPLLPVSFGLSFVEVSFSWRHSRSDFQQSRNVWFVVFTWSRAVHLCCRSISALRQPFLAVNVSFGAYCFNRKNPTRCTLQLHAAAEAQARWIHIFRLYLSFSLNSSFIHTRISRSYNVYPKVFLFFFFCVGGHKSDSLVAQQASPCTKVCHLGHVKKKKKKLQHARFHFSGKEMKLKANIT